MDVFDERKKRAMEKLREALRKGEVDKPIIPLLDKINRMRDYYTSSSCSGRIMLLSEGKSKKESEKYRRWHEEVSKEEFWKAVGSYKGSNPLWLRVEPLILHVVARSIERAFEFVDLARKCGYKRVGVQRIRGAYLIEMMGSDYVSIPLGICKCSEEIVELANKKLRRNLERLKKFEEAVSTLNKP